MSLKNKIGKKTIIFAVLSFVLPILIMAVNYAINSIYPGGKNTILTYDMLYQYICFFSSLKDIAGGDSSLFYSFSETLGGDYLGLFAYYMSSPISLITLLFDTKHLPDAIYIITLLKFGLMGLSFYIYLCVKNIFSLNGSNENKTESEFVENAERNNLDQELFKLLISCCYALMSYSVAYSVSTMWMDGVIMLPILTAALEYMLRKGKRLYFSILLALAMVFNYYTAFMLCLFLTIYCIYYVISNHLNLLKGFASFAVCGSLSAMLSAPLLLPAFLQLMNGKLTDDFVWKNSLIVSTPIEILRKLLPLQYDSISITSELPSIYCSTTAVILVVVYFLTDNSLLCKSNKLSENILNKTSSNENGNPIVSNKLLSAAVLLIFAASLIFRPVYRVWHCFGDPVAFPGRFAFVIVFFVLTLAYASFDGLKKLLKDNYRKVIYVMLAYTLLELFLNSGFLISSIQTDLKYKNRAAYDYEIDNKQVFLEELKESDKDFYRLTTDSSFTRNDPMLFGYNGIAYFSSTYDLNVMKFLGAHGLHYYGYTMHEDGMTPFLDSILGCKYSIKKYAYPESCYETVMEERGFKLIKNKKFAGVGFEAEDDAEIIDYDEKDSFENQNAFAKNVSGCDRDIFKKLEISDLKRDVHKEHIDNEYTGADRDIEYENDSFTVIMHGNGPVYLNCVCADKHKNIDSGIDDITPISVNGVMVGRFAADHLPFNVYLGSFKEGESFCVSIQNTCRFEEFPVYVFDEEAYEEIVERISSRALQNLSVKNGTIKGTIPAFENASGNSSENSSAKNNAEIRTDSSLNKQYVISVPYSEGFTVKLDGKRVKTQRYLDSFLSFEIDNKQHELEITYMPKGMKAGVLLFILAIVIMLTAGFTQKYSRKE